MNSDTGIWIMGLCLAVFFTFLFVWVNTAIFVNLQYTELIKKCSNPYFYYSEQQHQNDCDGVGLHPTGVNPK